MLMHVVAMVFTSSYVCGCLFIMAYSLAESISSYIIVKFDLIHNPSLLSYLCDLLLGKLEKRQLKQIGSYIFCLMEDLPSNSFEQAKKKKNNYIIFLDYCMMPLYV